MSGRGRRNGVRAERRRDCTCETIKWKGGILEDLSGSVMGQKGCHSYIENESLVGGNFNFPLINLKRVGEMRSNT